MLSNVLLRAYLPLDTAISVGVCIVAVRLDYCNSLQYGTSNRNLDKFQHIQNLLARTVAIASWSDSHKFSPLAAHHRENQVQAWATCLQSSTLIVASISSSHPLLSPSDQAAQVLFSSSVSQTIINSNFAS